MDEAQMVFTCTSSLNEKLVKEKIHCEIKSHKLCDFIVNLLHRMDRSGLEKINHIVRTISGAVGDFRVPIPRL